MNAKPLAGKSALITGASKGLGKAMALALADVGAHLVLVSRDEQKLQATAQAIRDRGGQADVFPTDVTDEGQVLELERQVISRLGRIQILINNAGVNNRKPITEFTLQEWQQVMDTNLTSAFLLCRAFVPHMKGQGFGRIINMTSIMSHVALAGRTAYAATKTGLLGFTRALALELAPEKITVNGISPGPVATEMNLPILRTRSSTSSSSPSCPSVAGAPWRRSANWRPSSAPKTLGSLPAPISSSTAAGRLND